MDEKLTFTTLGVDIHHIIIDQLQTSCQESLHSLSLVSKHFRRLTIPALYRCITLHDTVDDEKTKRIIERILDPTDERSRHIRELKIHHAREDRAIFRREEYPRAWTPDQLRELREQYPALSYFEVDLPLSEGKWPASYASALSHFRQLRTLLIIIELNNKASEFCAGYRQDVMGTRPMPPFNDKLAREVATKLFTSFFVEDRGARLTDLEVLFKHHRQFDRGETTGVCIPVRVRRMSGYDVRDSIDGGFTIESKGEWREYR